MVSWHEGWVCEGHGVQLDTVTISHVAWADDTWVFGGTQSGLEGLLQNLAREARLNAGLVIPWENVDMPRPLVPLSPLLQKTPCLRKPHSTVRANA